MIRKDFLIKDHTLTSSTPETIALVSAGKNIDKAIVAVSNGLAAGTDTVTVEVYLQFVPDGAFWEITQFVLTDNASSTLNPIPAGGGAWGLVQEYCFVAIKVKAYRTGANPVPISVEISLLADR